MIVHARTSHKHAQEFSASIAMLRGVAGVVAALSAASASAAAADEAGLVAVAQAHKTVAERHAAVAAGPALRLTSDAPPAWFLERARSSIQAHRINVAKEALERAETRLLDDRASAPPLRSDMVDRAVLDVGVARRALSVGDRARALYAIDDALAALTVSATGEPSNDAAVPAGPAGAPAPMPAAATPLPPSHTTASAGPHLRAAARTLAARWFHVCLGAGRQCAASGRAAPVRARTLALARPRLGVGARSLRIGRSFRYED